MVFIAILISLLLLILTSQPVYACIITIIPDSATGYVGETLTFTIDIQKTHRTCITPIDDTEINLKGMELVSQTLWQQVNSDLHRKQITVILVEVGEGLIEVTRECIKGGDSYTTIVTIKEAEDTPTPVPITPPPTQTPPPAALEPSWGEAFKNGITQPHIIATLVFTILGTVALIRRYRRLRYLILLASMCYLGFLLGGCPCSLGALQNVILRIGEIKERLPSYILLAIPVITAILFGRVFCAWVCPMGAVQHFLYRKETGKKSRRFDVSPRIHNLLRYGKYIVLVVLVITVLVTKTKICESIDPFKALFNIQIVLIPTSILVVLIVTSLFIGFPWCKYVCPLGAFLALFSRFSLFKVQIGDKCNNCKACHTLFCNYKAIKPHELKPEINQMECTRCGECITRCPHNAIELISRLKI